MKRWAFIIVFLYGAILMLATLPIKYLSFIGSETKIGIKSCVTSGYVWAVFAIFLLCQTALLLVPVRISDERTVSRSSIITSIIGAGLMAGFLIAGIVVSVGETIIRDALNEPMWWIAFAGLLLMWALWGFIFWRWSKALEPKALIERQSRILYRGSILELLIAIPAHILARHRNYCCAGMSTFFGIVFGISVMIFSFGPGVYFLYAERWKNSRTKQGSPNNKGLKRVIAAIIILAVIEAGAVLAYLGVFNKYPAELTLAKDRELQGITFPAKSCITFSHDKIESATLSAPLTIQGIKCQKGAKVSFYPSGKIESGGLLSESREIRGWLCPKDTKVSLYESDKIRAVWLESGATIQGFYFPAKAVIRFYESGKMHMVWLPNEVGSFEVNGISYDALYTLEFYESGAFMQGTLARDQEVEGVLCKKGTYVKFDEKGKAIDKFKK